ncbi:putative MFS family arabinose efflux permease [Aquimarina sp. EL_43]|uniref:MFS transporter n=1 Tax=unclassified Aquimarina TaxID=2627091 RepID=UPI0018C90BD5|nr:MULTISPECIES: MFS transporter [unclassified Aquimarina]MBG6132492.1 putative MFS family arabinose efflux permease [Aquimarina sp. EL_35]MBG6152623.1 putative MFS family arabinose efflux permease [Aquimarina sp. EL_32]MBG6170450.1 putative MFS family arabinose efflux permease [Aquimarina sp. EL_43]
MLKLLLHYFNSFSGLSKEVWWLALITLINRAGAMVIPFLSLYLTDDLNFSLQQVGWIMTSYGLGSFLGAWLGGKLSDQIGYYKVILISLLLTGVSFITIQYFTSFWSICVGFFVLIAIADMARPAFFVALSAYSKPENKTRSLTFIRLAINLGFSAGPAIGGLIIASIGYYGLFWVDGITCIIAGLVMIQTLHPKKAKIQDKEVVVENPVSAHKDGVYVLFLIALALFGFIFVQYFSTIPLYYKEIHQLSEQKIGLLLALNGALIFFFEMPLIAYLEKTKLSKIGNVIGGFVLTGISFLLLLVTPWAGVLVIGMIIATLGEMVAFPFGNAFALDRSKKGRQGAYMGLYSMSFSLAHIFGHNSGMQFINNFGFENTWVFMALIATLGTFLLYIVKRKLNQEKVPG